MEKHCAYKCYAIVWLICFISTTVHAQSPASKSSYVYLQQQFAQPDQQYGSAPL
jgi:hypothetical protein